MTSKILITFFGLLILVFSANAQVSTTDVTLKDAVGKRRIFMVNADEESRVEISKQLSSKGFSFVNDKKMSDLVFDLSYANAVLEYEMVGNHQNNRRYESKAVSLYVMLVKGDKEHLVYSYEYDSSRKQTMAAAYGILAPPPTIRAQTKHLIKDFLSRMKKAGDRFK